MADEKVHFDNSNYASQVVFLTTPLVNKDRAEIKIHGKVENTGSKIQNLKLVTVIYDAFGKNVRESSISSCGIPKKSIPVSGNKQNKDSYMHYKKLGSAKALIPRIFSKLLVGDECGDFLSNISLMLITAI